MTNSDEAIKEFQRKYAMKTYRLNPETLQREQTGYDVNFMIDLTALLSEHYVSKEVFEEQRRIYLRLFDEETSCMYCEAKIRRGSAIILCKECAENTEV